MALKSPLRRTSKKHMLTFIRCSSGKSEAIHETGLSGNVVASFFPLIIYIYIYIYIYININEFFIESSSVNKGNEPVSSYLHRNKALLRNS